MSNNNGTIINVSRTNELIDAKERKRLEFVFNSNATDLNGNPRNEVDELIGALTALRGKKVKLDFRVEEKTAKSGKKFPTAFLLVKEVVPKTEGTTTYAPKGNKSAASKAAAVAAAVEG